MYKLLLTGIIGASAIYSIPHVYRHVSHCKDIVKNDKYITNLDLMANYHVPVTPNQSTIRVEKTSTYNDKFREDLVNIIKNNSSIDSVNKNKLYNTLALFKPDDLYWNFSNIYFTDVNCEVYLNIVNNVNDTIVSNDSVGNYVAFNITHANPNPFDLTKFM